MKAPDTGQTPNPYHPPAIVGGDVDVEAATEVSFETNAGLRRHATDRYLLHWHPKRLLFSSLLMIAISGVCIVASLRFGTAAVVPTLLVVMMVSAAIYTALVYRTRQRIGHRLTEYGLTLNERMTLRSDIDQLQLVNSTGNYIWSNDHLRIHPTRRGLLICPAPLLFIFVPKKELQSESYSHFVKIVRTRVSQ